MEREACVCDHRLERSDLCAEIIIIIITIIITNTRTHTQHKARTINRTKQIDAPRDASTCIGAT